MKKIFLLVIICFIHGITTHAKDEINLIIGTFTNGNSKGLYSFRFNQQTGTAKALDSLTISNPTYFCFSSNGKRIYALSENNLENDSISAIDFDALTGQMKWRKAQSNQAAGPCFIETNGSLLLTANYAGGSISVFPLDKNGTIGTMSQQFKGSIAPSDLKQQATPHMHTIRFAPDKRHILASDFSSNRIIEYAMNKIGTLHQTDVIATLNRNSGPRHIAFSIDHRFIYVISELSGAVTVFQQKNKNYKRIQVIQSDSVEGHGSADIHFGADGRFLYTSNRLKADGISIFMVNKENGKLTKVGYQLTGIHPRNFNITPNGKFLLCACRDVGLIQVFSIDPSTGLLKDTNQNIHVDKPACVRFFPEKKN